jgi:hypothetical protein
MPDGARSGGSRPLPVGLRLGPQFAVAEQPKTSSGLLERRGVEDLVIPPALRRVRQPADIVRILELDRPPERVADEGAEQQAFDARKQRVVGLG